MDDLIDRQAAIDVLNVGAELLNRVLDDADIVGVERAKYEWGLGLIESYIYDMKELPSEQQWIPCSERLPEEKEEVLICDDFGSVYVAEYEEITDGEWRWVETVGYRSLYGIVAWMPLPEPYKREKS